MRGFLIPNRGDIKSFASQGGTIEKLWVKEGDKVKKDQPLATLVVHQSNELGLDLSEQLALELNKQIILLNDEIKQHEILQDQEIKNVYVRKQALKKEILAVKNQFSLADEKLAILQNQQVQYNKLTKSGYISKLEKERQNQIYLNAKQEKQNIEILLLEYENKLNQIAFKLENNPQQYTLLINNLKRQQADLNLQLAQVKNNHRYTVTASHNGVVTGIQIVEGETLNRTKKLLHILPDNFVFMAEILLPTRSAGFIQKGHNVRLRFDAFPYQRFGFIKSKVSRIDRTLILPDEVQLPIALSEPVYRLKATLDQQQLSAYGNQFELKSGMLFEADIMLEKRSLIDWLLEPIYSLKGKINS